MSSVHNAMRILKEFTQSLQNPELGISELSIRLGLAKSTVYRLLRTLNVSHLVEKNAKSQKYHLGLAAFELGFAAYHEMELRRVALPYLEQLMKVVHKVVHLGIYDQGEVVYLCKVYPEDQLGTITKIGKRVPVHCTSVGKVLLAHQRKEEIDRLLQTHLKVYTPRTVTSQEKLLLQLEDVRMKGYAVSTDELKVGISSVSIPVYNDYKQVIAAISVAGPTPYFYARQIQDCLQSMRSYSRLITDWIDIK